MPKWPATRLGLRPGLCSGMAAMWSLDWPLPLQPGNLQESGKVDASWQRLARCPEGLKHATDPACQYGGRAPGLHSPAGMLAILVIAYPDSDKVVGLKKWTKRLHIDWMMDQPRDDLSFTEGYWKEVNSRYVLAVFVDEKLEQAANGVTMLANYEKLFASEIFRCRNDMRPYLQDWANHLTLGNSCTSGRRQSADKLGIDGDNTNIGSHGSSSRDDPEDILPPLTRQAVHSQCMFT